ncbi:MAG TPA: ATP-binding protein [Novosphingobium sp.]|nr:ATP-binding protein [Novosphingobium sp.]
MPRPLDLMRQYRRAILPLALAGMGLVAVLAWQAGEWTRRSYLAEAHGQLAVDAGLRAAVIQSEVARFRLLPLAFAEDRDVAAAVARQPGAADRLDRRLEALARDTGAANLYLLDPAGRTLAASNYRQAQSFVGQDYAFRNYYQQARRSGMGAQFGMGTASHQPGLYEAHRTVGGGFIVVKRDFLRLEQQWAATPGLTLVTDANGIVIIASDPALRFRAMQPLAPAQVARFRHELQSGDGSLRPLGMRAGADAQIVALDGAPGVRWVHTQVPAGDFGWQVHRFVPVSAQIERSVHMAWALSGLSGLVVMMAAGALVLRRQRQRLRTIRLQQEVRAGTEQLRREIAERQAIEARSDLLREELRQANRLATLGQVTAGIAHETAQPVAAIRSYAENGIAFLQRGDLATAEGNFAAISRLTERIGTITAQLRSFARRREDAVLAMPVSQAVEGALLVLRPRLAGLHCQRDLGRDPQVLASRVRLEQVLVNLLQNAIDALADRREATIRLTLRESEEGVYLRVADNGPGIAPDIAARLFTPFATSRASGLGLGLVIARDIMREMGGDLAWVPEEQGAVFDLLLKAAP